MPEDATRLLNGMVPYLQFQSTLAFLKNPPAGYQLPAVDIFGGIQKIANKIISGAYTGEYAFQLDLWELLNAPSDAHLRWIGDVLGAAITFQTGWNIVSVSNDGVALPSIYMLGKEP